MGFERSGNSKVLKQRMASGHKRSKSFPDKSKAEEHGSGTSHRLKLDMGNSTDDVKLKNKKSESPKTQQQNSLKQEILQLEKRLQDQFAVRGTLEKALGYGSSSHDPANDSSMPKPATELIKEIAVLELEVVYLEQYLLSLYRKAFDQQTASLSPPKKDRRVNSPLITRSGPFLRDPLPEITPTREAQSSCQSLANLWRDPSGINEEEKMLDSGVHRCHSSLSQHSAFVTRNSPTMESMSRGVRACHSQPLSTMEYAQNSSSHVISLAEHLGTRISDHVPQTPNRISEEMIKCMSAIFCKLADPPSTNHGLSSPSSSLSSMNAFSPQDHYDTWSPAFRKDVSFDTRLDNPFHVEGLKEFSGPYSTMVEVPCIYRDEQKLVEVEHLTQNFRSLVSRLEDVDPRRMKHDEKLAFWVNVHNALVMHAFLAYGVPQHNVKRMFLLLKAAYNVGGRTISADTIQSCILGCRMSRPGQWIRLLISPRMKFKTGDRRQAYAIEHPEPLLYFALCSGSHSDPAVRAYTPKRVFQELEAAKEEYIRATFGVRKDRKIILPKIVESFAKDADLCPAGVLEMIHRSLPDSLRKSIKKCTIGKSGKCIEWVPHNFSFRYLISKEMVK